MPHTSLPPVARPLLRPNIVAFWGRGFSLIRDGRVAPQKSDRFRGCLRCCGHWSRASKWIFCTEKGPFVVVVARRQNGPNGASFEAWKCPPNRDQLGDHELSLSSRSVAVMKPKIEKRSIILQCLLVCYRQSKLWMTKGK